MSDERVMVPREPTAEMLVAMALKVRHDWGRLSETDKHNILHQVRQIYRAMLDAAPAAPQQAAHNAREINNLVGKTDSQQAGPVWMRPDQLQKARHAPFLCRVSPTKDAPDLMPMFLHPPAAEVQRLARDFHRLQVAATAVTTALYDRERLFAVTELRAALDAMGK